MTHSHCRITAPVGVLCLVAGVCLGFASPALADNHDCKNKICLKYKIAVIEEQTMGGTQAVYCVYVGEVCDGGYEAAFEAACSITPNPNVTCQNCTAGSTSCVDLLGGLAVPGNTASASDRMLQFINPSLRDSISGETSFGTVPGIALTSSDHFVSFTANDQTYNAHVRLFTAINNQPIRPVAIAIPTSTNGTISATKVDSIANTQQLGFAVSADLPVGATTYSIRFPIFLAPSRQP